MDLAQLRSKVGKARSAAWARFVLRRCTEVGATIRWRVAEVDGDRLGAAHHAASSAVAPTPIVKLAGMRAASILPLDRPRAPLRGEGVNNGGSIKVRSILGVRHCGECRSEWSRVES